ncbi:NAD(P)/FAD-dependent oxidoreductase [Pseudogemmobacter humi]|uniref:Gamma-glutamylputrescine oxidoreductase n=1 Tax=Pseudogemmobacter humi TaxID=2483812 RepID=A0A3P5WVI4_9RHOB|nr:FAD-binding oxidoreductase [Pseudogemmobacter humi]VDC22496.1 Gamma-glutamylputrescine oxidoreductase [Pseudogemmobacter humi]
MLNDPRSHGLWEKSAPPPPATPALEGEAQTDVAVIGAGYTGLSTALHLVEQGISATVIEAAEIGFGGAGRNVGLVNAGMWVMPEDLIRTLGTDYGNRLLDFLGAGPSYVWEMVRRHAIDCEANPVGTLHAGDGKKGFTELTERARQWQARGAPVELMGKAEAALALGTGYYEGALLDRRAGTIQPLAYARGLAHAAVRAGAVIHTSTPATGIARDGNGWRITTPRGALKAGRVVLATDAYTRLVMQDIARQQVTLPYFNMATRPLPEDVVRQILPGRQGVWDTREVLLSFRYDAQNRLVFGSVGALRNTGTAIHRAWAKRALRRIYPQIGTVEFESEWFGSIGMTSDNLPRFHRLDEGIFAFCGYNGRGIAPGTVFGRAMASFLAGKTLAADLPLPLSQPAPTVLRGLRSAWYEAGAQLVHLAEARF